MHTSIQLENIIEGVLHEISKFGLCFELNCQYRRIYNRFIKFALKRNKTYYSSDLIVSYRKDIEKKYKAGEIGNSRRNHLRRASFLLQDYVDNGTIEWKVYVVNSKQMPSSQELLSIYSTYIEYLEFRGWSDNTVQSSKNLVRQFLLFIEDNGCNTFSMVTPDMVPSFFQHLLTTYNSTSIRTVASHLRSFLRFIEDGDRLLPLVPSRCIRNKPIIPILSNKEYDALKCVLQSHNITFRDKAIIQLALRTGLRSVDILGIRLSDIDWIDDTIAIIQSKTGKPLKIPITTDVGNSLSSYILKERPKIDDSYVFLRSIAPYKTLSGHSACYAIVRKSFHKAGIRLGNERKGVHVIRHSMASRMLSKGVPVTIISSILGHSSKTSTDIYLVMNENQMRECALPLTGIPMLCGGLM